MGKLLQSVDNMIHAAIRRVPTRSTYQEYEDLYCIAQAICFMCAETFDESKGCKFVTYFRNKLVPELRKSLRQVRRDLLTQYQQESISRVLRSKENLWYRLNREPTIDELKEETSLDQEDVIAILGGTSVVPLSQFVSVKDWEESKEEDLLLSDMEDWVSPNRHKIQDVKEAVKNLVYPYDAIIQCIFYDKCNFTETSEELGIPATKVRKMLKRALARIHDMLEEEVC